MVILARTLVLDALAARRETRDFFDDGRKPRQLYANHQRHDAE
jgi:hypothetical protein